MIELCDMCSIQNPGAVNFDKMAASGIRGVYFKASQYSAMRDLSFAIGVKRAQAAGLKCGAYHFAYCGGDPVAQMQFFAKASGMLGAAPDELPPMIDWEYAVNGDDGKPLTNQAVVDWLVAAAKACAGMWYPNGDRLPTIYSFPEFDRLHQPELSQATELAKYPLTWACYPNLLTPPAPWQKATLHQYEGNDGRVPGVTTACDRDRFLGTEDEFQLFLGNQPNVDIGPIIHKLPGDDQ